MRKTIDHTDLVYIYKHTSKVWQSLVNSRIFITGGTGFFGIWLLESFLFAKQQLSLNAEITVLTRNFKAFAQKMPHLAEDKALHFIEGDVRSFDFPAENFTHIIHAATEASAKLNAEAPLTMLDVILKGTQHTFEFAKKCGAKNILLTSSGAIYGRQPPEVTHLSEDYSGSPDIQKPASAYGVGKRTAEHLATLYHAQHQLNIKIARCFAFVGPHLPLDTHFAIGNFIRDGLAGKAIQIGGDGTPYRSYQYAADLVIWLWHILCFAESCVPYNVGSDEGLSIAELANRVAENFSPCSEVRIAKSALPNVLPERYVPAVMRAKKELGLENYIDLQEALRRTINWYKN